MALATAHKHLGFKIEFDALIQPGTIHVNPADWPYLHSNTADVASAFQGTRGEALLNTDIDATQIGPLSGPESGTGPLVGAGSLETPAVLVPNPDDSIPNPLSTKLTQDGTVHLVAAEPMEQPYPTDPVPPEPTENVEHEHVTTHTLPEHPVIENQPPETPQEEWLRKEREAKS